DANPLVEHRVGVFSTGRFSNEWTFFFNFNHAFPFVDDAETRLNPMVRFYAREGADNINFNVGTNPSKVVSGLIFNAVNYDHLTSTFIENFAVDATVLAASRLQLGLHVVWQENFSRARWVTTGASGLPLFGVLDLRQLETTVRGTFAFTRNVTLQLFSQLLLSSQRYPHVLQLADPHHFVPCDDASTCADAQPPGYYDYSLTSLKVNA